MCWAPIDIACLKAHVTLSGGTDGDRNKTLHKPQGGAKISSPGGKSQAGKTLISNQYQELHIFYYHYK